jgi:3-oxoacyl-[acyl-carrier protein] reductase
MPERIFEGRTALVTGGSRGIGAACCRRLAQRGAKVAINYRTSQAAANETAEAIKADGGTAAIYQADVSSQAQVQDMVNQVSEALGPVDMLVNNAGIFHYAAHDKTTLDMWQQTLDINLTGTYLTTWAVKDGMVERRYGRIVNISSLAALRARPMSIAYAVSKAGLTALTKGLAEALAPHNIRVNAVAPGLIETDILDVVDKAALDKLVAATPIPRIGVPDDIAKLVSFLLSEDSSFTTGQTFVASGGRAMLP